MYVLFKHLDLFLWRPLCIDSGGLVILYCMNFQNYGGGPAPLPPTSVYENMYYQLLFLLGRAVYPFVPIGSSPSWPHRLVRLCRTFLHPLHDCLGSPSHLCQLQSKDHLRDDQQRSMPHNCNKMDCPGNEGSQGYYW